MGRRGSNFISRYINCSAKGAISLFMAVLMTPFLTIAMVLMDAGRYNSAVSILDEAMGVSAVSALANCDSYLHERWGLLAAAQNIDINNVYGQYLTDNAAIMGESIELESIQAKGDYALSENAILYSQILEYCKWNAPAKLAANFLNLSDLIKKLEGFGNIGTIFSSITSGVGAIDSTITLVESAEKMKEEAKNLEDLEKSYNNNYDSFSAFIDDLIAALNVPEPEESDYTDEEGNFDSAAYDAAVKEREENIESARESAVEARDKYTETIGEITTSVENYKKGMDKCTEAAGSIRDKMVSLGSSTYDYMQSVSDNKKNLDALQKEIKEVENDANFDPNGTTYQHMKDWEQAWSRDISDEYTRGQLNKATVNGLKTMDAGYQKTFSKYSESVFEGYRTGLEALKTRVADYSVDGVTESSSSLDAGTYHSVNFGEYVTKADIEAYLEKQKEELLGGSFKAIIDGLVSFYNSLVKMSLFYDPGLSAVIDMSYYNTNFGGLPGASEDEGGVMTVVNDIGSMMSSIKGFGANLMHLKLLQALKDLKTLIESIAALLKDLAQFALDICHNIGELFASYDRLYYSTYTTFNLPCRTQVSMKTMTGYSLGSSSFPDQGISAVGVSVFDDLAAAVNAIQSYAQGSGDDLTFSGAELEYILYGSKTEICNQIYTFFAMYLLRLLFDIVPVLTNPEVQSLAAASTFGYPVVMVIELLAEPLVDTILLVNGTEVPLIETTIYLTPSGLPVLLEGLQSIVKFTPDDKEEIKSSLTGAFGAEGDSYDYQSALNQSKGIHLSDGIKGLTKFNYREHCFMLMLLTVTKEQQFARLKNLIQMETTYHYRDSYQFDLRKSYTYLQAEASVHVKQMFPSLIDSSLLRAERKVYRGY